MMADNEILDAVKRRHPAGTELTISRTIPGFLDGELVVVDITRGDQKVDENFYYVSRYPSERRSFISMDELALWIGQHQSPPPRKGAGSFLTDFRVVSAIIAIVITFTICAIVLGNNFVLTGSSFDVPDILSNALTTILGFYFGSQVARSREAEGVAADRAPPS
jgi:hypothetical protein